VVVGLSTSGNSRNVRAALVKARERKGATVVLTGNNGTRMSELADVCIHVPSSDPARIQEAHILFGHMLCQWVELASCINHAVCNIAELR
jgi:D-sedoheptulose 7-phosphate isomerase